MRLRSVKRRRLRAGGALAGLALLAFAFDLLHTAFQMAHSVNDALLNFGEIFQKTIPLETIIAGAFFAALVGGVFWFHADDVENCCKKISQSRLFRYLKNDHPILRYFLGAMSMATLLIAVFIFLPHRSGTQPTTTPASQPFEISHEQNQLPAVVDPPGESPDHDPPLADPTLPKSIPVIPPPRPRMAGRNVCDLLEDPTNAELTACTRDILKHPYRKGTGGPICIMIKVGKQFRVECLPWPPLPRRRPPLNILPNLD
jgi:hypothetical protein